MEDHSQICISIRKITSPEQAVDRLSELVKMSLWSDSEWIPYEEDLRNRLGKYEL
ncbi:hypothetical protein GQA12_28435 [Paenibacillus alvei]|nr:hypothetical protein [Paenibacillus alvei]